MDLADKSSVKMYWDGSTAPKWCSMHTYMHAYTLPTYQAEWTKTVSMQAVQPALWRARRLTCPTDVW